MGQIAKAKIRLAQAKTEEDQNKMKLGMSRKELVELEKRERACREEGERMLGRVRAEVEAGQDWVEWGGGGGGGLGGEGRG